MIMLILSWIIFGGIVGLIARAVFPGRQSMGVLATMGVGIAGSFLGGMIANAVFGGSILAVHASGWIGSLVGALVVLALLAAVSSRRSASTF